MKNKSYIYLLIAFIGASISAKAQNPVILNAENNRNSDIGMCWVFPGTVYTGASKINGQLSLRTGQLTGGQDYPNGAQSPWIKFNNSGTIKWKMKLDRWAGVVYRRFAIIKVSPQNNIDTVYKYNFSANSAENVVNGNIPVNFTGVYKLRFYFYGKGGTTRGVLDDVIIDGDYWASPSHNCEPKSVTPNNDTDGDGVTNDKDAFPNDPTRAFECYYPATNGPGTLMFEDLWPKKGDYDLNDLVAEYKVRFIYNAQNNLVEAFMTIVTKALGAGNSNGFMYQLDKISPNKILSVTGSKITGSNWVNLAANGTEIGQQKANILIFDNGNAVLPNGSTSNITNAEPDKPYFTPDTTRIKITFDTRPGNTTHFSQLSFNPYLIANQKRGVEIHLPGFAPSDKADRSFFGTFDDNTILSTGKYYQTSNNLPWAIDVHTTIPYMQEQKEITTGYSKFLLWAQSNGTQFNDWYLDVSNNRVNSNLYLR
jgi:LruC domain-containing protein